MNSIEQPTRCTCVATTFKATLETVTAKLDTASDFE